MLPKLRSISRVVSAIHKKCLCTVVTEPVTKEKSEHHKDDEEWVNAKPYECIPGPKPVPIFGNLWRFLPGVGTYKGLEQLQIMEKQYEEYGDIFKLSGMKIRPDMVFVFTPPDIETVFRNDGPWPRRNALKVLHHFMENEGKKWYPDGYGGIFPTDGAIWQEGRHVINPILMQTKTVKGYVEPMNKAADKFIERVNFLRTQHPKGEMPEDFIYELHKWSLESVTLIALNIELGLLDPDFNENSESHHFIKNILDIFDSLYKLEVRPSLWKYVKTPTYRKLVQSMEINNTYIAKKTEIAIEKALKEGTPDEPTILKRLMKMDKKYLAGTVRDMLTAGVDTTSKTMGAILYFLSCNKRVQEKLREEVMRILPTLDTPITSQTLEEMPYLRAVIKESLRIVPIGVGTVRQTQKNLVLSGYKIPSGTNVFMGNLFMCKNEKYFPQPDQFLPERWLRKDGIRVTEINPWVYMPFGYGPRACIGKRLANLELEILVAKMVRNFKMDWYHGEMKYSMGLLYGIGSPLKIQVTALDS